MPNIIRVNDNIKKVILPAKMQPTITNTKIIPVMLRLIKLFNFVIYLLEIWL